MPLKVEYLGLDFHWKLVRKGPDWELRSVFSLEIGPEKVQNDKCYRDSWHLLKIVQGSYL